MKNIVVTYHNEVTVNLGNFENIKPGYSLSAQVSEGETAEQVRTKLRDKVNNWLSQEVAEIREEHS